MKKKLKKEICKMVGYNITLRGMSSSYTNGMT